VFEDSELVIGLVAPVGTNFEKFQHLLGRCLKKFGYETDGYVVRLSELTANFQVDPIADAPKKSPEAARIYRMMHAGNQLRFTAERGEFLALAAAKAIRARRPPDGVLLKTAHVVRSLKHPDEVRALRRIYGSGFYLIGVTVGEEQRRAFLQDDKGCSRDEVDELLKRDEHEEDDRYVGADGQNYGQRTRDTFQLADVFIPLDDETKLERFFKLVFGCPFVTPTQDEYAMFLAFGSSLRSGDLSRQVGAVVVTEAGDLVAVGANDVPCAGGGLYWPGPNDQ
jgi:deoxycytidylate deaminase